MKENAYQSIIQGKIYISVQKNYKHPRQLNINNIHTHTHTHTHTKKEKKNLHVRIILNYAVKS